MVNANMHRMDESTPILSILFILDIVTFEISQKKKKKLVQFILIYHLLSKGRAMTNFEGLKNLFIVFKVKHILKKHWTNYTQMGHN
jgi:hypothetical protein